MFFECSSFPTFALSHLGAPWLSQHSLHIAQLIEYRVEPRSALLFIANGYEKHDAETADSEVGRTDPAYTK